jgi:hypothetical protein
MDAKRDRETVPSRQPFEIGRAASRHPYTYAGLPEALRQEVASVNLTMCVTWKPYKSDFGFHYSRNVVSVSIYVGEQLRPGLARQVALERQIESIGSEGRCVQHSA